jgi:hypothetical protein
MQYQDDLLLLAKEEAVPHGMTYLIDIGKCYGVEMNVEKTKVMRISRLPSAVWIMLNQKQLENVDYFYYLGSVMTDDARCTFEIKLSISMTKAAFKKKKRNLVTSHLELYVGKKLV